MTNLLLALLFVVVGSVGSASAQQWVEHRPAGAGYRIEFPAAPTVQTRDSDAGSGKLTTASYDGPGDIEFLAIHNDSSTTGKVDDPQAAFDSARNSAIAAVSGKMREETRLTVEGLPARRIVVDIADPKLTITVVAVLKGQRLYQAIAVVPRGQEDSADVKRFFGSFHLVPR